MIHIAIGTKVVIEDLKPKPNWIIEDNYNEFADNARGPRGSHQVIGLFEAPDSTEQEPKYVIPLPCFLSNIASEAASGTASGSGSAAIPIANLPPPGPSARRRLARRGSAASSARSEPEVMELMKIELAGQRCFPFLAVAIVIRVLFAIR